MIKLSPDQENCFYEASEWIKHPESRMFILSGEAGTGKSTLLSFFKDQPISFCAPTGKASDVLRSKGLPATTIHRLIYDLENGSFQLNHSNHKPIIAIDEGSMISQAILNDLLKLKAKLLIIGDPHQLPPVGEDPHLLANPTYSLTEIHRNAALSPIITFAHQLRQKTYIPCEPSLEDTEHGRVQVASSETILDHALSNHPISDLMIITAKNQVRLKINSLARKELNLTEEPFTVGDLVVCKRNNYKHNVFNGQLYYIEHIFEVTNQIWSCTLRSYDDNTLYYSVPISTTYFNSTTKPDYRLTRQVCLFDFGYCLTAHYAQGSEFENVVVIEPPALGLIFKTSAAYRWRYTAATRARKNLYYGSPYIKDPS